MSCGDPARYYRMKGVSEGEARLKERNYPGLDYVSLHAVLINVVFKHILTIMIGIECAHCLFACTILDALHDQSGKRNLFRRLDCSVFHLAIRFHWSDYLRRSSIRTYLRSKMIQRGLIPLC